MMTPLVYRITAPHFSSVIAVNYGTVTAIAKPVRQMAFWNFWKVMHFCERHGWIIEQVKK